MLKETNKYIKCPKCNAYMLDKVNCDECGFSYTKANSLGQKPYKKPTPFSNERRMSDEEWLLMIKRRFEEKNYNKCKKILQIMKPMTTEEKIEYFREKCNLWLGKTLINKKKETNEKQ